MAQDVQEYSRLLDVTLALFTGIVIAAVSSWITVQLSLRRFRTERWWERKAEAYERIISALHDSKVYLEEHFHAVVAYEDGPKDAKELSARMKAANAAIGKAIDTGAFLLSAEALARLKQYQEESRRALQLEIAFEYYSADLAATNTCLKDLIEIAKRDLKAN